MSHNAGSGGEERQCEDEASDKAGKHDATLPGRTLREREARERRFRTIFIWS